MKLSKATLLLKAVLIFCAIALALVAFGAVPAYMQHVIHVRPDLAGWDYWMRALGLLIALPVWGTMVLLWQIFDTIPKNNPFIEANAKRFAQISRLAEFDLCIVGGFWLFLIIAGVTPPFLVVCFSGALFGGVVAAVVFHVLGGLVCTAAELRQDSELTI
ncbi:MAG: DUF2975 domain-containing protein [Candidatus Limiplasma sp.]|nr:DUF2975 domain-containing protein [Candidatus Limiplasma sp.]